MSFGRRTAVSKPQPVSPNASFHLAIIKLPSQRRPSSSLLHLSWRWKSSTLLRKTTSFLSTCIAPLQHEGCGFTCYLWRSFKGFFLKPRVVLTQKPVGATFQEKLSILVKAVWHYDVPFPTSQKLQTHRHTRNRAINVIDGKLPVFGKQLVENDPWPARDFLGALKWSTG